jgi:hypothetical protein
MIGTTSSYSSTIPASSPTRTPRISRSAALFATVSQSGIGKLQNVRSYRRTIRRDLLPAPHPTHDISKQSIGALFRISKNFVLLRLMKSITINTMSSQRNSHFIQPGLYEAVVRGTSNNLEKSGEYARHLGDGRQGNQSRFWLLRTP